MRPRSQAIACGKRLIAGSPLHSRGTRSGGWSSTGCCAMRAHASAIAKTCGSNARGLFGRVRRTFLEIGRRLNALNILERPTRHVLPRSRRGAGVCRRPFDRHLSCANSWRFVGRSSPSTERLPPPADRFETRGMVYHGHTFQEAPTAAMPTATSGAAWAVAPASSADRSRGDAIRATSISSAGRSSSPSTPTLDGS